MSIMDRSGAPDLFTYEIQRKVMKTYSKKHYKECYLLQHSVILIIVDDRLVAILSVFTCNQFRLDKNYL